MSYRKEHTHTFVITVRMNKACTARVALRAAQDNIHGDFYPSTMNDGDPDKMKISSIRRMRPGVK